MDILQYGQPGTRRQRYVILLYDWTSSCTKANKVRTNLITKIYLALFAHQLCSIKIGSGLDEPDCPKRHEYDMKWLHAAARVGIISAACVSKLTQSMTLLFMLASIIKYN